MFGIGTSLVCGLRTEGAMYGVREEPLEHEVRPEGGSRGEMVLSEEMGIPEVERRLLDLDPLGIVPADYVLAVVAEVRTVSGLGTAAVYLGDLERDEYDYEFQVRVAIEKVSEGFANELEGVLLASEVRGDIVRHAREFSEQEIRDRKLQLESHLAVFIGFGERQALECLLHEHDERRHGRELREQGVDHFASALAESLEHAADFAESRQLLDSGVVGVTARSVSLGRRRRWEAHLPSDHREYGLGVVQASEPLGELGRIVDHTERLRGGVRIGGCAERRTEAAELGLKPMERLITVLGGLWVGRCHSRRYLVRTGGSIRDDFTDEGGYILGHASVLPVRREPRESYGILGRTSLRVLSVEGLKHVGERVGTLFGMAVGRESVESMQEAEHRVGLARETTEDTATLLHISGYIEL